jgi:DNA-binding GntR family transcriptional regulator
VPPQSTAAYHALKEAILSLELRSGEALSERKLEERLSTSRTTVRAALFRLESEGLVRREGRGLIVTPLDLTEIEQACVFRELIEPIALRLTAQHAPLEAFDEIEKIIVQAEADGSFAASMIAGADFHLELVRLCGNAFLVRSLEDVLTRLERARWIGAWRHWQTIRGWHEHRRILGLLRERRLDAVELEVRAYLTMSREQLLEALRDEWRGLHARGIAVVE